MQKSKKLITTQKLTILAMISAIAFILAAFVRFPIVPAVGFLRFDPKDVVIVIGGFLYGPLAALIVVVVVAAVQMFTVSQTAWIGFLMNVISSGVFCCTAALIYGRWRTLRGAMVGLILAVVLTTGIMLLWNYIITPLFMPGVTREAVVRMLIPGFLPFNLINWSLNAALVMLLYKPVKTALQSARIISPPNAQQNDTDGAEKTRFFSPGILIASAFVIITCVLWIMILRGIF